MKEKELREASVCGMCGNKIGAAGVPLFYRVKIQRFALNLSALQRQQGLGMMVGAQLAQVLGPNEELAEPLMDALEFTICEACCTEPTCVAMLEECVNAPDAVPAQVPTEGESPNCQGEPRSPERKP